MCCLALSWSLSRSLASYLMRPASCPLLPLLRLLVCVCVVVQVGDIIVRVDGAEVYGRKLAELAEVLLGTPISSPSLPHPLHPAPHALRLRVEGSD